MSIRVLLDCLEGESEALAPRSNPKQGADAVPVVNVKGPAGLTKNAKKELIEGALHTLIKTYQMPDDRVYIEEVPEENAGHTPLLTVAHGEDWAVQSEPARIFVEVTAPPGLPIEAKRVLMRELTEVAGRAYGRKNLRDVLVSLDEHKVEDFAANGFLQTENPEMAPFAATLRRR
jgi:phenylpyruvate tautomerase PptA (4-oxalocrotonate tautomerase family)